MNQHYVPRAYLKNFSNKKRKEYFVNVYDKKENRYFETNIKNICSEIDLYTLGEDTTVAEDLFVVEKIYSNGIEPLYLKTYEILTNNNIFSISELQRAEILISIFQLYLRNPRYLKRNITFHKNEILKLYNRSKENATKGITYLEEDFSFREWELDSIIKFFEDKITKKFKEEHVGGIAQIGEFHENAIIEVTIAKDKSEFITSDNPLVLDDLLTDNEHPLQRSKEFLVALNKKMTLRIYHDNTKEKNRIYRRFMPSGSVAMMNKIIFNQSSRFIIADKEILEEHFKICRDFLDNTSLELKMNAIRQIVTKFPITAVNKESTEILKYYLAKYDKEGHLSDQDQYEMYTKTKKISTEFVKTIIK